MVPNPVRGTASVTLALPTTGAVRVAVYDALGREAVVAFDGVLTAGSHRVPLAVLLLAPGAYVVRVQAGAGSAAVRLAVAR